MMMYVNVYKPSQLGDWQTVVCSLGPLQRRSTPGVPPFVQFRVRSLTP